MMIVSGASRTKLLPRRVGVVSIVLSSKDAAARWIIPGNRRVATRISVEEGILTDPQLGVQRQASGELKENAAARSRRPARVASRVCSNFARAAVRSSTSCEDLTTLVLGSG